MKKLRCLLMTGLLLVSAVTVLAQAGPGDMPGMDLSFIKLFGEDAAFSTRSEMSITDSSGRESLSMVANIAMLEGKMRTEVDMTRMKGPMIAPRDIAQMKELGLERVVSIARLDKKLVYVVYPGLKAYASTPIPEATLQSLKVRIQKTELGRETVERHPCVKNRVALTDDSGKTAVFTVWNATDLKDFPVRFQTADTGNTVTSTLKDLKLARPDPKQFDPPSHFKAYPSLPEMMMAVMAKMKPAAAN